MRRKKLISPEKPVQDSIEYRFKLLFWPYLSYAIVISILGASIFGIFLASIEPINIVIINFIYMLFFLLILETIIACVYQKIYTIKLTKEGIRQQPHLYNWTDIDWQEIVSIEISYIFVVRSLLIKRIKGSPLIFTSCFYETDKILDRVRELAGSGHILVRALEKELSRPRRELTKLWVGVIGAIALTMSVYLIGGNMYAAEQEKPLEHAIAAYVRQHPKTEPNDSAIELQALMTKLGLSVNVFGDRSKVKITPTPAASDEWRAIQTPLSTFINERLDKTEDSSAPIPAKLAKYLKTHQAELDAIETHLATSPIPEWGNDSWISKSNPKAEDSPLFSKQIDVFSLAHLQNLTIVNLFDKQPRPNADLSRHLVTLEKLQQSIRSQQSLMGQLISVIGESRISKLVRQIDSPQTNLNGQIPEGWGNNLFDSKNREYVRGAIEHESLIANKFMQNPALFDRLLVEYESPLRLIPGLSHLMRPHLRLAAVDRYREVTEGIAYWSKQNICRTDGKSGVKSRLDITEYTIDPLLLISQYPKVLKQDLLWELTTSVRQAKAQLAAGQNVDLVAKNFKLQSQVCPGEQWTAKATDGSVNVAFSHSPDWKALGMSNSTKSESLTYIIKLIAKT
jgi:hypothetical protein